MWQSTFYKKLLSASLVLAVLLAIALNGASGWNAILSPVAEAQSNQPADTVDLFKPFWETWQLLHDNYVDQLDDNSLVVGAENGLIDALNDPAFDLSVPAVPTDATSDDARFVPFWDLWTNVHNQYQNLDDNALMEGALRGMMAALGDPHTDYMDPDTFAQINESMSGEYEGIGATVKQAEDTGGLELVSIIAGSPAEQAGLLPGDQIVRVEGEDITTLSQNEIVARVRGPAGTPVRLGILRPGETDILKFEVMRQKIVVPSVVSRVLSDGIGYIRLSQFEYNTGPEMRTALEAMDANNLKGLILDVRGNPGGYLTTAIQVASAYIQTGTIVIERGPGRMTEHPALNNAIAPDVPMVILVDQGSASASELIAGALQDYQRATVVGMQTFGKGSVQSWHQLSNGGGIRITISRWYTPDDHSVSEVGIQPDVVVPFDPTATTSDMDNQLAAAVQVLEGTYTAPTAQDQPTDQASE